MRFLRPRVALEHRTRKKESVSDTLFVKINVAKHGPILVTKLAVIEDRRRPSISAMIESHELSLSPFACYRCVHALTTFESLKMLT